MGSFDSLKNAGLTNAESEGYGAMAMGKRLSPVPFCSSDRCLGRSGKTSIRKCVEGYPTACPDCGHALVWRKVFIESKISSLGGDR